MKILVSLILALLFGFLFSGLATGYQQDGDLAFTLNLPQALAAFLTATLAVLTVVLLPTAIGSARQTQTDKQEPAKKAPKQPQTTPATAAEGKRQQGTVKWFNPNKGFGFISASDDTEVFVHYRHIRSEGRRILRQGQSVTFIQVMGEKGPQAEDVEAD